MPTTLHTTITLPAGASPAYRAALIACAQKQADQLAAGANVGVPCDATKVEVSDRDHAGDTGVGVDCYWTTDDADAQLEDNMVDASAEATIGYACDYHVAHLNFE